MSKSTVKTAYVHGGEVHDATVSVEIENGIGWHIIGLPDNEAKETLLRVITAIQNAFFVVPGKKVVITVNPADAIKDNAPGFDLPIAVALLEASGQAGFDTSKHKFYGPVGYYGSLRLDGAIKLGGDDHAIIGHLECQGAVVCSHVARKLEKFQYNRRDYSFIKDFSWLDEFVGYARRHF